MKPAFHTASQSTPSRFHRDMDACALLNDCGDECAKQGTGTHHD